MLSMFLIVSKKVNTLKVIITSVKINPQKLELYGSALSMGLAPKISKNLKKYEIPCKIFYFKLLFGFLYLS